MFGRAVLYLMLMGRSRSLLVVKYSISYVQAFSGPVSDQSSLLSP